MCITPDGHSEFQDYPGPDAQLNEPGAAAGIYASRLESWGLLSLKYTAYDDESCLQFPGHLRIAQIAALLSRIAVSKPDWTFNSLSNSNHTLLNIAHTLHKTVLVFDYQDIIPHPPST